MGCVEPPGVSEIPPTITKALPLLSNTMSVPRMPMVAVPAAMRTLPRLVEPIRPVTKRMVPVSSAMAELPAEGFFTLKLNWSTRKEESGRSVESCPSSNLSTSVLLAPVRKVAPGSKD